MSAVAHEADLADRNRQHLEALCRMLTRARGFRLGFAVANHPSVRERLAAQCRAACEVEPILEVTLDPARPQGIVAQLERAVGEAKPAAMFVHGLESMLDLRVRQSPAMDLLNLNRDYCWRRFPWPVVFVAPLFAVREFARQAPDFWSGYSGIYHFVGDRDDVRETLAGLGAQLDWSLEQGAKLQGREILDQVRAELDERSDEDPAINAELLSLLARTAAFESDLAAQERLLTEALAVYHDIGDRWGRANSIQSLGDIAYMRARYDEAAQRYEQALAVYHDIGDRWGRANSIQSLGDIARMRARYDEAAQRYERRSRSIVRSAIGTTKPTAWPHGPASPGRPAIRTAPLRTWQRRSASSPRSTWRSALSSSAKRPPGGTPPAPPRPADVSAQFRRVPVGSGGVDRAGYARSTGIFERGGA